MLRALAVTAAVGLLAPPTAAQATSPAPIAAKIVTALRAKGLPMTPKGRLRQPFFEPPARVYANPDGDVQMWQFRDERRARAAAAGVSSDGSTVRSGSKIRLMEWLAPPHWFRRKSVVVLYLGSDGPTLSALRNVLGAQFAGLKGPSAAVCPACAGAARGESRTRHVERRSMDRSRGRVSATALLLAQRPIKMIDR